MGKRLWAVLKRAWDLYKNLRAGGDLLKAFGIWKVVSLMLSGILSTALTIWASVRVLSGPLLALVFLGAFLLVLMISLVGVLVWKAATMPPPFIEVGPPLVAVPRSSDKKTLEALQSFLPSSSIAQLRTQQFWGTFKWTFDGVLVAFHQWGLVPEHRFLDATLEQIHAHLREASDVLFDKVHRYSEQLPRKDGLGTTPDVRGFSPLGKIEDMEGFEGHRNETYEAAKRVCEIYDDLVLAARRKFET